MRIERVQVLHGHHSPDTAYLVPDYPYNFRQRCSIRYWIETAASGQKRGQQRFVSQTTRPTDRDRWNQPKRSLYAGLVVMYLDANQHVQFSATSAEFGPPPEQHALWSHNGIAEQLDPTSAARYQHQVEQSRARAPQSWQQFETTVYRIVGHIAQTGAEPVLDNGIWHSPTGDVYIGRDHAIYLAAARAHLANNHGPLPSCIAEGLSPYAAVTQSWLIHPDWTPADHLTWLDNEGYDLRTILGGNAIQLIAGWLDGFTHTDPATVRSHAEVATDAEHGVHRLNGPEAVG